MRRSIRLRWIKHRRNRDGSVRVYVCQPGRKPVRLPTLPENHPDFLAAYQAAVAGAPKAGRRVPTRGTIDAVIVSYRGSPAWRALARSSQEQREREFRRLVDKAGDVMVATIEPRHIRADLSALSPGAASNRLKAWRTLMAHAVAIGLIDRDPAREVRAVKHEVVGHHSWTAKEREAFRAHWPIGTDQRLGFELASWTGARRSDLVRLGWQMVGKDGWLTFRQQKTGGEVSVPFNTLPPGCAALGDEHAQLLDALAHARGRLLFIETAQGRQRSDKAMSAWFRRACDDAGLPDRCSLHGLRKARAASLAELGWSEHRIGAWTGHVTLTEIVHYTRAANRKRMIQGNEQSTESGTPAAPRSRSGQKD